MPDLSKFLDLLKASGWQTGMMALFAGLFLHLSKAGLLPPLDPPWVELLVYAFMFVCAAALGSAIRNGVQVLWARWRKQKSIREARSKFISEIPYLSAKERQISGYLREKKQKTFDVEQDGGYAATLMGRRYVYIIGQTGQALDPRRVPVAVAEHVWEVMLKRPEDFPYQPEIRTDRGRKYEMDPWRIPWELR